MKITAILARHLFYYNKATGVLRWKNPRRRGQVAGANSHGYIRVKIDGQQYAAHQIIHLHVTGKWARRKIDHKNGKPGKNHWNNLRTASMSQNIANSKRRKDNTSGFKGVDFSGGKYRARICKAGKSKFLGLFDTAKEAHVAYMRAARANFYCFARAA